MRFVSLVSLSLVAGCAGFNGATNTLEVGGPASLGPSYTLPDTAISPGPVGLFEISYARAYRDQQAISAGTARSATSSGDQTSVDARQMAVDGVNLAQDNCVEFFRAGGSNQKWLYVARDLTTVIGTAATGVLALSSPANATAAGAVALATATAYNGVDLYTRNFLFGADNIDSVRILTLNALAEHKSRALPANDTSVWSFGGAVEVINDHQVLCSPATIRSLVLAAISGGTVTAFQPAGTGFNPSAASVQSIPSATQAAANAAPNAPQGVAAAAANAAASSGLAAAANAGTPDSVSLRNTVSAAALPRAVAAAAAAGASPTQAKAAGTAAATAVASQISGAIVPNASPSTRHLSIQVNGQHLGQ